MKTLRLFILPVILLVLYLGLLVSMYFLDFRDQVKAIIAVIAILPVFLILPISFYHFQDIRGKKTARHVTEFLLQKGVEIEERVHPITYIDIEPKYYEEASETCYSLRHRYPKTSKWRLDKTKSGKGNLSNGWNLVVERGEISKNIADILDDIARDEVWSKKYLEIGCDEEKVWAFWNVTDGIEIAQKVYDILERISGAEEALS